MKNILYNLGYFLKEVKTLLRLNLLSNILSILSTGLIFFILAMMISGWWVSGEIVEAIQGEAEISIYYVESTDQDAVLRLIDKIKSIHGVREVKLVDENEAYERMADILGKEANVLKYFNANPFSPFIEVRIQVEEMNDITEKVSTFMDVEYVRDNKEILEKLQSIARIISVVGYLIVTAAGISTLVIIAHIIRMGIHDNKEQINTLRLMGAPESFVAFPFFLEGLVITLGGGIIASAMTYFAIKYVYSQMTGPLPFIPLPQSTSLIWNVVTLVMLLGTVLGIVGSGFGLASSKRD